jgi:hypothetical protein
MDRGWHHLPRVQARHLVSSMNQDKHTTLEERIHTVHRRGRTQAMLDEAVDRAQHGEQVLVLAHDEKTAEYFRNWLANVYGPHLRVTVRSASGGHGMYLGVTWNALLVDHYVYERAEQIPNLSSLLSFLRTRIVAATR